MNSLTSTLPAPFRQPLLLFLLIFTLLIEAKAQPKLEEATVRQLFFNPYVQTAVADLAKPWNLELIADRHRELDERKDAQPLADLLRFDQAHALGHLVKTLDYWQSAPLAELIKTVNTQDREVIDLQRMRAQNKMHDDLLAVIGYAFLANDDALKGRALAVLEDRIARLPKDPARLLTTRGNDWEGTDFSGQDDPRRHPYLARDAALLHALRYTLKGDSADARTVEAILHRLAKVMPEWQLRTRENVAYPPQTDGKIDLSAFTDVWGDNGLWGIWNYMELAATWPLVQAYILTKEAYSPESQKTVETGVFDYILAVTRAFPYERLSNLVPYYIEGLIPWGRALHRPELVREAADWTEQLLQYGFLPDGFWRELTPDYHRQVMVTLACRVTAHLSGYRGGDPLLDGDAFLKKIAPRLQLTLNAFALTLLPDGTSAALGDTEANTPQSWFQPPQEGRTRLLGASGLAILGHGKGANRTELFLLYRGSHGHHHEDALAFLWYAHGMEIISETTYRGTKENYRYRPWYQSASAHQTVVVDETPHFDQKKEFYTEPERLVRHRSATPFNNQGKLLLLDDSLPEARFLIAEAPAAYAPRVSRFERTVVMVPFPNGDSYLVDLFRVEGGQKRDYMLHAGLNQPYEVTLPGKGEAIQGNYFEAITLEKSYPLPKPTTLRFAHANGIDLKAHLLAPLGNAARLLKGEGPAIRRNAKATYLIYRDEDGEGSTFAVVYEAIKSGRPLISQARLLPAKGGIAVEVETAHGRDLHLSTDSDDATMTHANLTLKGRLGFLRYPAKGGPSLAHLASGTQLTQRGGPFNLVATQPQGEIQNSVGAEFLLDSPQSLNATRLIHIDFDDNLRFTYPLLQLEDNRATTTYPTDLILDDEGYTINAAPGWRGSGPLRWHLPQTATWRAESQP